MDICFYRVALLLNRVASALLLKTKLIYSILRVLKTNVLGIIYGFIKFSNLKELTTRMTTFIKAKLINK